MNHPATLRELADLIADGLPAPIGISMSKHGFPTYVNVSADDLGPWLSRLDLPEPWWEGPADDALHATWPPGTFDGVPYILACVSFSSASKAAS